MLPAEFSGSIPSVSSSLLALGSRAAQLGRDELRASLLPLSLRLRESPVSLAQDNIEAAISICRVLYLGARSSEALLVARAALGLAERADQLVLRRRAAMLCGVISADAGDVAGAIEFHALALRLSSAESNVDAMSRTWNNIGLAMAIAGQYELANRCYRRALGLVEHIRGPVFIRYAALMNEAHGLLQLEEVEAGLGSAHAALREETPLLQAEDLHGSLLLRRNFVRLLLAAGRLQDAEKPLAECMELANATGSPRSQIASATARAMYELAAGRHDLALTRLEGTLARARRVPAAFRDTLTCLVRAEEAAGNIERALVRLNELSDHIYEQAVERARSHLEMASIATSIAGEQQRHAQHAARLVSYIGPPGPPQEWPALERLAVSAALRMDPSGWHGKRVGALVKGLAQAMGSSPLHALDMGLAAEVHDIGMLSVPEGILRKAGRFNEAEAAVVRRHVAAGMEILADDSHPRMLVAREVAAYHHARWDGSGHPEGVKGGEIPLAARICAVADAYDAMVCGLAGRPPRKMDDALAELERCAGTQFDPELVARFTGLVRAESEDLGLDITAGMEDFQELVAALQEDRGFV